MFFKSFAPKQAFSIVLLTNIFGINTMSNLYQTSKSGPCDLGRDWTCQICSKQVCDYDI